MTTSPDSFRSLESHYHGLEDATEQSYTLQTQFEGSLPRSIHQTEDYCKDGLLNEPNGYPSWTTTSAWCPILPHPSNFDHRVDDVEVPTYSMHTDAGGFIYDHHHHVEGGFSSAGAAQHAFPESTYPAAHQPVAPEQRSAYSELAVNLDFMKKLQQQDQVSPRAECTPSTSTSFSSHPPPTPAAQSPETLVSSPTVTKAFPKARRLLPTPRPIPSGSQDTLRPGSPTLSAVQFVASPTTYVAVSPAASPPTDSPSPPATIGPIRNVKEPRRPSLACTFCRERKIACGRPPGGSPDPTCNQCARRSFKCEYVKEQKSSKSRKK